MNQPTAEELFTRYGEYSNNLAMWRKIIRELHLIDKTEPVSGGVTAEELEDWRLDKGSYPTGHPYDDLIEAFDIYPLGTVARLRSEIMEVNNARGDLLHEQQDLKEEIASFQEECSARASIEMNLQAEVDRLGKALDEVMGERDSYHDWADQITAAVGDCGEHSSANQPWQNAIDRIEDLKGEVDRLTIEKKAWESVAIVNGQTTKPTEVVGCGRVFDYTFVDGIGATPTQICGKGDGSCPDCQAKASQPIHPHIKNFNRIMATKKVELPDVPQFNRFSGGKWDLEDRFGSVTEYLDRLRSAITKRLENLEGFNNDGR